jgi:hypothetical protein
MGPPVLGVGQAGDRVAQRAERPLGPVEHGAVGRVPPRPGLDVIAEEPDREPGARAATTASADPAPAPPPRPPPTAPPMAPASSSSPCRTRCSSSVISSGRRARAICPAPGVGLCPVPPRGRRALARSGGASGVLRQRRARRLPTRMVGARSPTARPPAWTFEEEGVDGRVAGHAGRQVNAKPHGTLKHSPNFALTVAKLPDQHGRHGPLTSGVSYRHLKFLGGTLAREDRSPPVTYEPPITGAPRRRGRRRRG